jgi:cyanophycin synthetase
MPTSRRVHGRRPLLPGGGAALDHDASGPEEARGLADGWLARLRDAVAGTPFGPPLAQVRGSHVTLALPSHPEHRGAAARLLDAVVAGDALPAPPSVDPALRRCLERVEALPRPRFVDEEGVTVGVGRRSRTFEWGDLPFADDVDLSGRHAPCVLVSGTNGKTTTANLIAAVAWADGWLPGVATSNGIRVGRAWEERGDWSGAGAARRVMRHDDVNFAVLETARGGILRRGVLVEGAHVAVLTNVSADHLGEGGIDTVDELAEVKVTLARALAPGGAVVVNDDDEVLRRALAPVLSERPELRVLRFSSRRPADAWLDGAVLRLPDGAALAVAEIPLAFGGAAVHNVENALAAALAGVALGIGADAIREGLAAVSATPEDNPGRGNLFRVRGATALVEYAHNPDALRRLGELSRLWPARRRAVLLGQAGDRPEGLVRALATEAAGLRADRYVLKPLPGYARGRDPAEVVRWLREGLREAGVPDGAVTLASSELDGVAELIRGAEPGDLLFVLVHEALDAAVDLLRAAG